MSFGICVLVHTLCSSQMFQPLYTFQNQLVYTVFMWRFFTIPNSALNDGFGEKIPALNLNKQTHITWMSTIPQQFLFCFVNSKSLKADHNILIVKGWPHLQMSSGWANSLLALAWLLVSCSCSPSTWLKFSSFIIFIWTNNSVLELVMLLLTVN